MTAVTNETGTMKEEATNKSSVSSNFDSSDDEDNEFDLSPFKISWLDLTTYGIDESLGISALPGCRFKDTWRKLENDIKCLVTEDVKEVFCLCSKGELNKYRVPRLLSSLQNEGITVHHTPFPDGTILSIGELVQIIDDLHVSLMNKRKVVIHCYGGLGRSCFVAAALMMKLDTTLSADKSIEVLRELRGPGAVQSVKAMRQGVVKDMERIDKKAANMMEQNRQDQLTKYLMEKRDQEDERSKN